MAVKMTYEEQLEADSSVVEEWNRSMRKEIARRARERALVELKDERRKATPYEQALVAALGLWHDVEPGIWYQLDYDLQTYPLYDALAMWLDTDGGLAAVVPEFMAEVAALFLGVDDTKRPSGMDESMRVFTCVDHHAAWPVGVASVVVAGDDATARELLDAALIEEGLQPGTLVPYTLQEINLDQPGARVLQTGEY